MLQLIKKKHTDREKISDVFIIAPYPPSSIFNGARLSILPLINSMYCPLNFNMTEAVTHAEKWPAFIAVLHHTGCRG